MFDSLSTVQHGEDNSDSGGESDSEATPTASGLVRTESEPPLTYEQLVSPLATPSGHAASLPDTISKQDLPDNEHREGGATVLPRTGLRERLADCSDGELSEDGDKRGCGYDGGLQDLSIENKSRRPFRDDQESIVSSHTGALVVTIMYLALYTTSYI